MKEEGKRGADRDDHQDNVAEVRRVSRTHLWRRLALGRPEAEEEPRDGVHGDVGRDSERVTPRVQLAALGRVWRQLRDQRQVRYLRRRPAELEDDDECAIVDDLRVLMRLLAAETLIENHRKRDNHAHGACE